MKTFLITILFVFTSLVNTIAQCGMMPFVQGRTLTYDIMNAQGKQTGSVSYYFKEVNTSSGTSTAVVTIENKDSKGKVLYNNDVTYKCNGTTFSIDMRATLSPSTMNSYKDKSINGESAYLDYPSDAPEGTTLKDGNLFLRVYDKNDNEFATISSKVINRKVVGNESLSTESGNYKCLKISGSTTVLVKTIGLGLPIEGSSIEWWSAGTGMIKSETYNKSGKLTGTITLRSVK